MVVSAEEDGPGDSATTTEASAGYEKYMTCPRDWRQRQRQRGIGDGIKESTTTTEASEEEDENEEYNNNNGGISGGYTTCPRELEMTKEAAAARLWVWRVGNNNGVFIFLAIASLTVTLYRLCLVAVSF